MMREPAEQRAKEQRCKGAGEVGVQEQRGRCARVEAEDLQVQKETFATRKLTSLSTLLSVSDAGDSPSHTELIILPELNSTSV